MTKCRVEEAKVAAVSVKPRTRPFKAHSGEETLQWWVVGVGVRGGGFIKCVHNPPGCFLSRMRPMAGAHSNINKVSDPSRDDEFL